jgi:hypothetical protein
LRGLLRLNPVDSSTNSLQLKRQSSSEATEMVGVSERAVWVHARRQIREILAKV